MKKMLPVVIGMLSFILVSLSAFAAEESTVVRTRDGALLSAKWTLPESELRAAVVILQGSGNVGLDGDVSGPFTGSGYKGAPAKLSDQLAEALAKKGVASLRYSKRGFDDARELPHQTISYLVEDAVDALTQVQNRFPFVRYGFVGFSEGALVSLMAASRVSVDALYLLSLPTRGIDEMFNYQFVEWPVNLLKTRLATDAKGELTGESLGRLAGGALPILGAAWSQVDANRNGTLSVGDELLAAYRQLHAGVLDLMSKPPYEGWYKSLREVAPIAELAARVTVPVFLYHATDDAQVNWAWLETDRKLFTANNGQTTLRFFGGLGHCFAPMDGAFGEVKTSGPFDARVLEILSSDVAARK